MKYGIVYLVTCFANGKQYVGQTIHDPERYWRNHHLGPARRKRSTRTKALWSAIRKYGEDAFAFEVIASAQTKLDLDALEIALILQYNSLSPNGYNLRGGGEGSKGILSLELRLKIGAAVRTAYENPETKRRRNEAHRKALANPESRERLRQAALIVGANPDVSARRSAAAMAVSSEKRKKRGRAIAAAQANPVVREKLRLAGVAGAAARWGK